MKQSSPTPRSIGIAFTLALLCFFIAIPHRVLGQSDWDGVLEKARGQTVRWHMYGGYTAANSYVNDYVVPRVASLYDIDLTPVFQEDVVEAVSLLLGERDQPERIKAGVDLMWINGENFRTCTRQGLLFGPFAAQLPNQRLVDWSDAAIHHDFGLAVNGMESPWGRAQMVFFYDSQRIAAPPASIPELLSWIRLHPGRFTYPEIYDSTGSAFVRHVFLHLSDDIRYWQGGYLKARYTATAKRCFDRLNGIAPYLWKKGTTYPKSTGQMHRLFAAGEIDFSMSYQPSEASAMIRLGLFPPTVRSFVLAGGTLSSTHYLAIPKVAGAKEGAMVVANFLLSPEAQLKKANPEVWGDFPVIAVDRLAPAWQKRFAELTRGVATLPAQTLQSHRLAEPRAKVLLLLERGWRRHVLGEKPAPSPWTYSN